MTNDHSLPAGCPFVSQTLLQLPFTFDTPRRCNVYDARRPTYGVAGADVTRRYNTRCLSARFEVAKDAPPSRGAPPEEYLCVEGLGALACQWEC
jgi:hypothetical protein